MMREVIRLIAFAIVTFGITFLALLFSNPQFSEGVGRALGLIPPDADAAVPRIEESETVVQVFRPHLGTWIGLEGFPSQASMVFPIPPTAKVTGGQLQLNLATDLIDHGDGLVEILINNRKRDAIVLETGETEHLLTYDLLPSDLALGAVTVNLVGNGTTNSGQVCPNNVTNLGAAVEILPTSAVMLQLSEPLSDIDARVVLEPDPLPLDGTTDIALSAWATQFLSRQDVTAEPTPPELSQTMLLVPDETTPLALSASGQIVVGGIGGVAEIGRLKSATLPAPYSYDWPLPVGALTTDTLTHTFRGSTHWDLSYKLVDLPDGLPPQQLHLTLRTSQLMGGNQWTLRVLLNGQMIHSAYYPGTSDSLVLDIDLPIEAQGLVNMLTITLVDNSPNQGICRAGPEAAAQLLPESELLAASAPMTEEQTIVAALAAADTIGISAETEQGISATTRGEGLLDLILPLDIPVSFTEAGDATIRIVEAQNLAGARPDANTRYIFPGADDTGDPLVLAAGSDGPVLPSGETVGLAVSW